MYEFGVEFENAYECTHPKVDKILNAFGEPHSADMLFENEQIKIDRLLIQTGVGMVRSYKIMYIAHLLGTEKFIITCGTVRIANPSKMIEYEKIGKRKLYRATRQIWNIQY